LDRARIAIAQGRWADAERDCHAFFQRVNKDRVDYAEWADACLLQGFLKEQHNDSNEAADAWKMGLLRDWPGVLAPLPPGRPLTGSAMRNRANACTFGAMLASLTGACTDHVADLVYDSLINDTGVPDSVLGAAILRFGAKQLFPTAKIKSVILRAYSSTRGKELARNIVFRRIPLREFFILPFEANIVADIRVDAIDGNDPPELESLIWRTVHRMIVSYNNKQLTDDQVIKVLLLWLGLPFIDPADSWRQLATRLPSDLRGPLAYGFGRRYLKLGIKGQHEQNQKLAAFFFEEAKTKSPPDSAWRRLAETELDALKRATLSDSVRQ
jgi:hypothetical protein